jgi:hypothetical protein
MLEGIIEDNQVHLLGSIFLVVKSEFSVDNASDRNEIKIFEFNKETELLN